MKTLVFDTSLDKTYVTLSQDGQVLTSKTVCNKDEKYHSAFLISTIVQILKDFKLTIQDIDTFGVNVGPGSFTGIRACITVARVFAQQTEKPLVGVSSLEILSKINKSEKNTLVLLDARRQQVYSALYDKDGNELQAPQLTLVEDLEKLPLNESAIICDSFVNNILKEKNIESTDYASSETDLGIHLCDLVNKKVKTEYNYFWANLKPLYLQTPPVSARPKQK